MPKKPEDQTEAERQQLLDRTAIALFARGWPEETLFMRAERFLKLRDEHLKTRR